MRSSCLTEVSSHHSGSRSSKNRLSSLNRELGRGRLWQGWLRSWALLQASNPPAKESQLSSSSSHSHPAPGMRPAGSNKKKPRQEWEVVPEVPTTPGADGSVRCGGTPRKPVVFQGTLTKPTQRQQNPCHPETGSISHGEQKPGRGPHPHLRLPMGPC